MLAGAKDHLAIFFVKVSHVNYNKYHHLGAMCLNVRKNTEHYQIDPFMPISVIFFLSCKRAPNNNVYEEIIKSQFTDLWNEIVVAKSAIINNSPKLKFSFKKCVWKNR